MTVRSKEFRRAEAALYNYPERSDEVERIEGQALGAIHNSSVSAHQRTDCHTSSVERGAIMLADAKDLDEWRKETRAVKRAYDGLKWKEKKLVRLKYWDKESLWRTQELAKELQVSRWTVGEWRKNVVEAVWEELIKQGIGGRRTK